MILGKGLRNKFMTSYERGLLQRVQRLRELVIRKIKERDEKLVGIDPA